MPSLLLPLFSGLLAFVGVFLLARRPFRDDAIADGDRIWRTARGSRRADRALAFATVRTGVPAAGIRVLADWETQALTIAGRRGDRILVSAGAITTLPAGELAGLIAHELGHVAGRHIAHESVERALRLGAVAAAVSLFPFSIEAGLIGLLVSILGGELLLRAELRRHERDADRFAQKRGFGPALGAALLRAEKRDGALVDLTLLLARAQLDDNPILRPRVRGIERRWGGLPPDEATLRRWIGVLRPLTGPTSAPTRRQRHPWIGEIHEPATIRARRLRTAARD